MVSLQGEVILINREMVYSQGNLINYKDSLAS